MKQKFNHIIKPFIAIFQGLLTILSYGFKQRVTLEYPEKKKTLPARFRGKPQPQKNETGELTCSGCGLCIKSCPVNGAISIKKEKDNSGKNKVVSYEIDLSKCIFCGNCVFSCPDGHIIMSKEFELATEKLESLLYKNINQENIND